MIKYKTFHRKEGNSKRNNPGFAARRCRIPSNNDLNHRQVPNKPWRFVSFAKRDVQIRRFLTGEHLDGVRYSGVAFAGHELATDPTVVFVFGEPALAWKRVHAAHHRVVDDDAVQEPAGRNAGVVVA